MFGLVAILAVVLFEPEAVGVESPGVSPIVGGDAAGSCEFPSAVAILEDDETPVMCSGTLVHPSVVTLAAHCVNPQRPIVGIGFGEQGQGEVGPQRVVEVDDCVGHPQYFEDGYPDIAYCTLTEPVLDVPRVPILAGCELEALQPGVEVTIVGYGSNYGTVVDGEVEAEGVGPKRRTTQTIDDVEEGEDEVHMVGPDGSTSACFGDSGGPAMIEMADGTWRVFGAASRLYDPGGFPPPELEDNVCGIGVTYGLLTTRLAWLEAQTGHDLTPCHDEAGEWSPSAGCGDFPMDPDVGVGAWDSGCVGGPLGGGEPLCEPAMGTSTGGGETSTGRPPDATSTGAGDGESSGSTGLVVSGTEGGDTTGTTGGSADSTSTGGDPTAAGASSGGSSPDSETSGSGSGADADGDAATGCGCRGGGGGAPVATLWMGLGLLALRRRR